MDLLADVIAVAQYQKPAELVLRNGQVMNLFNGAIETTSIAIHKGRIAGLGNYKGVKEIDLKGALVVPGFIDGHIHLETTMLRPEEAARVLLSKGTTTVVAEAHEIANVAGMTGLKYIADAVARLPIDVFFMAPSSVPSTSQELETNGASLDLVAVSRLLGESGYIGLGEVMNYPGVIKVDKSILSKIAAAKNKPIDGHCPGLSGSSLNAYLAAGLSTDHEATELWEAKEKLAKGMKLFLRQSSISKDFERIAPLVNYFTARRCMLASDDRTALDLSEEGGVDMLVRMAIEHEIDPRLAVQMVTLNPAEHYGLNDRGTISPGKIADLVILEDMTSVSIRMVLKNGEPVFADGKSTISFERLDPPESLLKSIQVKGVKPGDFQIFGTAQECRVIGYRSGQTVTDLMIATARSEAGRIVADTDRDIVKIAVVNRYREDTRVAGALIKGFGLKKGALASSVSHDAHNIVTVGVDDLSMATAVNSVIQEGGGMVAALEDAVLAKLPLEIAGLMSLKSLNEVKQGMLELREAAQYLGTPLEDPFAALSFMTLAVIPSIKLTNKGLVDVVKGALADLFIEGEMRRAA